MSIALWAVLAAWPALAEETKAPAGKEGCTSGCHEEVANENEKHQKLKCVECHPNVTDGQAKHAGAMDDMPTEKMCSLSGCHTEAQEKLTAGLHKDASCETCHSFVHDAFKRFDKAACKGCHGDAVKAFNESVHVKTKKKQVACTDCHGEMHDIKKSKDPLSPVSKVLQVTTCGECHDTVYVRAFRTSVHGQGLLRSGLEVAPACTNCHGAHDVVPVKDEASRISRQNVTNTCGTCHTFIVTRWKGSTHGELWAKGDKKGPVCTSCHPGHHTFDPRVYGNHLRMADKCGECHASQSESYRDSFHGKATRMGFQVAATCADCHTPHEMLPEKDPHSSVNPAHLLATCQRCHEAATEAFTQFNPHLELSKPGRHPVVHYVWLFMTGLLLGTFGFFSLHTLLWLQRSIVAFRRKEFHHPPAGTVWIRRFRPLHIWIHLTIVVTFLLLAATGLPLKFSNVEWARPIGTMLGGLGVSRVLHRLAGVLTFGYSFVFLGYLIREIGFKKRRQLLFGWQSMTPNLKDLKDLFQNLRWFLYLGERPKLDRWAYWEKFDFFAVFWGVPMIGFSGLLLWEPTWMTHFMPGWLLNIAYLIHSDEALLATGFIFFFHFFHTHLRPEAFPLDPVVFVGAMPLERFIEERPAEYERLKASGELKDYEVPGPDERTMRRVHRFGFTALSIGLLLGVLLMIAGFRALVR